MSQKKGHQFVTASWLIQVLQATSVIWFCVLSDAATPRGGWDAKRHEDRAAAALLCLRRSNNILELIIKKKKKKEIEATPQEMWNNYADQGSVVGPAEKSTHTETHPITLGSDPRWGFLQSWACLLFKANKNVIPQRTSD